MRIEDCPVKVALDVIGGKWKPLILFALKERVMRYGELRRFVEGSTHKVLTEQLRQLEASGVIRRESFGTAEPYVEYRLSEYGETLRPMLAGLAEWGSKHRDNTSVPLRRTEAWKELSVIGNGRSSG